jgi:ribosomal-protein-alanine N-acetyltransferase
MEQLHQLGRVALGNHPPELPHDPQQFIMLVAQSGQAGHRDFSSEASALNGRGCQKLKLASIPAAIAPSGVTVIPAPIPRLWPDVAVGHYRALPRTMQPAIDFRRIRLRDLGEHDRAAFIAYQMDPRYRRLYDYDDAPERPNRLFDLFLEWQRESPRINYQFGIFERSSGRLLGCGGLRTTAGDAAVLGIELAPGEWGRFRLALDAATALVEHGFDRLHLTSIVGDTASGNSRVTKLASRFGASIVAHREGPPWMQSRGWHEVQWAIARRDWQEVRNRLLDAR